MASCGMRPDGIIAVAERLSVAVSKLEFSAPVTHVYNPLEYAWQPPRDYLERYATTPNLEAILLGMNPGPFGMAQTGVPFGEVDLVRNWLGVEGEVGKPSVEHPKRPVQGFGCPRSEVSGRRLWGWARQRFEAPEAFFERFCVANYCPLMFMEESGRNRTPDNLPVAERAPLLSACDRSLKELVELTKPRYVVGVGRFAEQRAQSALQGMDVRIGRILHPSPASPAANRDWQGQVESQLAAMGIEL